MYKMEYYPVFVILLEFIFTYIISSLVVFQCLSKLTKTEGKLIERLFVYSLGLGPLSLAWLLVMLMFVFPALPHWADIGIINIIFLIPFVLFIKQLKVVPSILSNGCKAIKNDLQAQKLFWVVYGFSILLILAALVSVIVLPFAGNDPLEYAILAKFMYLKKSVSMYPILTGANTQGFIAPFTHPLAYVGSFIWCYLIQGTASHFGLIHIVSMTYFIYLFLLVVYVTRQVDKLMGAVAGLLLVSVPIFIYNATTFQIDAIRIFSFFLFFMFIIELRLNRGLRFIIPAGCILGLALFCHSISILALPLFVVVYLFFLREKITLALSKVILVCLIGLLFVLQRYIINIHSLGGIIHDGTIIRQIKALNFPVAFAMLSDVNTAQQKWFNGFLGLFHNIQYYGFSYLVLLFSLFFIRISLIKRLVLKGIVIKEFSDGVIPVAFLCCLAFFAMVILSIFLKINDFIESARYMISFQPFVAVAGAWSLVSFSRVFLYRYKNIFLCLIALIIFIFSPSFMINNFFNYNISFNTLFDSNLAKMSEGSPSIKVLNYFVKNADVKYKLLSFRDAEPGLYNNVHYIYSADPILQNVYKAKNVKQAYQQLLNLNVHYVFSPDYTVAYISNSYIQALLGEPGLSKLIYQTQGSKLFQLTANKPYPYKLGNLHVVNNNFVDKTSTGSLKDWVITRSLFSNKKMFPLNSNADNGVVLENKGLFTSIDYLYTGNNNFAKAPKKAFTEVPLKLGNQYLIRIQLSGKGLLNAYLATYNNGNYVSMTRLFQSLILSEKVKTLNEQFKIDQKSDTYRLVLVLNNQGSLNIKNINLYQVTYPNDKPSAMQNNKIALLSNGWHIYQQKLLHTLFYKLKSLIEGLQSYKSGSETLDWKVIPFQQNFAIQFQPTDSHKYNIVSQSISYAKINPSNSLKFDIKGKGQATINIYATTVLLNTHLIFSKTVALSSSYQPIKLQLYNKKLQQLIDKGYKFSRLNIVYSYQRPSHKQPGNIVIGIPKATYSELQNNK